VDRQQPETPADLPSRRQRLARRDFLKSAGGFAAFAALQGGLPLGALAAEKTPKATDLVPGKDPSLVVLSVAPIVLETPLDLLAKHRVTPKELLFVRDNEDIPEFMNLKPVSPEGWEIEFTGLVNRPMKIEATKLARMEQVEHEVVMQCSGNSRALFAQAVQSKGTQWGRGGVGNVAFAGVPLRKLIESLGLEIDPSAAYLTAQGKDNPSPGKEDFEHSIPLDVALERSFVALRMNGEPIPGAHGGPVRLITPGYYATMNIKWLTQLRFEKQETSNYNQIPRYRLPNKLIRPGEAIEYTFENSSPNYDMKVKSIILTPAPREKITGGKVAVRGIAWNDGQAALESVLISTDRGKSWSQAKLDRAATPYAWSMWEADLSLPAGRHEIWSRAVDALGRTQPLDGTIFWNPSGYEWNGVEKIEVTVA